MNFALLALENENEGTNEIKKVKFEKINILISGSLFQNFINLIKSEKTKISCVINIVVFTSVMRRSHIEEICNKENDILNGLLFRKKNIFCSISQIQEFLLSLGKKEREKEEIVGQLEEMPEVPNEIICKYWARAYTLETNFYRDM